MHKAKEEKPNPTLTGCVCVGGVCVCVGNQSEVHERWDMNSHNSITKEVQLLLKACLSSVVNMVEPTLKTSIVY